MTRSKKARATMDDVRRLATPPGHPTMTDPPADRPAEWIAMWHALRPLYRPPAPDEGDPTEEAS